MIILKIYRYLSDLYKKIKCVIKLFFILVDVLDIIENILFVYIDVIISDEYF